MIPAAIVGNDIPSAGQVGQPAGRPVFRMVAHERMGGSVPVWERDRTAQAAVAHRLEEGTRSFDDVLNDALLSYAPAKDAAAVADEPFGFGDLVDIVNPLHHIPLVGMLYRAVTGDQIRPSSQIVGGAIFGGLAGAAGGLASLIVAEETGKNVEEHVVAAIRGSAPGGPQQTSLSHLEAAAAGGAPVAPSGHALGFSDFISVSSSGGGAAVKHNPQPAAPVRAPYMFNQ